MQLITIVCTGVKMMGVNVHFTPYAVILKEGTSDTSFGLMRSPLVSTDIH